MTTILPWRRAAAAVDSVPTTEIWDDETVNQRLSILELESKILECTGKLVTLEGEAHRVINRRVELMGELAKRVSALGLKVEVPKP